MNIIYTTQFKKDYKKIKKQNKDLGKFRVLIEKLSVGEKLDSFYKDHLMSGRWKKHRNCFIEPDWILIYRMTKEDLILERMGSHSELFK